MGSHTYSSDGSVYFRIATFPGVRQALAQRFQRQSGRRARGRGRVRKSRRPRFRAVEGAQRRRALLGHGHRSGPARLAHRMFRDGDQVPGRDAGYPRGRRRPDLSAPRKRDRAIGIAHRQAVFALLAARRVSAWWRGRRCPSRWAITTPCATCWARGYAPESIRYLLASVPYRKPLNFTFDGLKSAATAIERLRNFKLRLETDQLRRRAERKTGGAHRAGVAGIHATAWTTISTPPKPWRRSSNTCATPTAPWIPASSARATSPARARISRRCSIRIFDVLEPSVKRRRAYRCRYRRALIAERTAAKKAREFALCGPHSG